MKLRLKNMRAARVESAWQRKGKFGFCVKFAAYSEGTERDMRSIDVDNGRGGWNALKLFGSARR